jgi:hypothetical protein
MTAGERFSAACSIPPDSLHNPILPTLSPLGERVVPQGGTG